MSQTLSSIYAEGGPESRSPAAPLAAGRSGGRVLELVVDLAMEEVHDPLAAADGHLGDVALHLLQEPRRERRIR